MPDHDTLFASAGDACAATGSGIRIGGSDHIKGTRDASVRNIRIKRRGWVGRWSVGA